MKSGGLGDPENISRATKQSNKSMTKSELTKFFVNGQKKVEEDVKSRIS